MTGQSVFAFVRDLPLREINKLIIMCCLKVFNLLFTDSAKLQGVAFEKGKIVKALFKTGTSCNFGSI
jgi:hypothetical protein